MANKYTDAVFELQAFKEEIDGDVIRFDYLHKMILWCLAHRMNQKVDNCWPGYGRIAKDACCDRRTAIRVVKNLIALNLLEKVDSFHASNTYRVNYDAIVFRCNKWTAPTDPDEAGEHGPVLPNGFQVEQLN